MKPLNVLGAVVRYILAAVSCISLAQFLVLLNVGTENAGRLAGQSLLRGVISGVAAAIWFYRARKASPQVPANVQTQEQVAMPSSPQAQTPVPPSDSISATAPISIPITDHSNNSFWEERRVFIGAIAGVAVVIVFAVLAMMRGTSHQQRFVYQGPEEMFDTKTSQTCFSGAIQRDNGLDAANRAADESMRSLDEYNKALDETGALKFSSPGCTNIPRCELAYRMWQLSSDREKSAGDRFMYLNQHPDQQPIIHVKGLPYCSELK